MKYDVAGGGNDLYKLCKFRMGTVLSCQNAINVYYSSVCVSSLMPAVVLPALPSRYSHWKLVFCRVQHLLLPAKVYIHEKSPVFAPSTAFIYLFFFLEI